MKKYVLFLVIIILILGIMFTQNVKAEKPTAYSPEIPDLADQLYLQVPNADPILGHPYGWGEFTVRSYGRGIRAWWVTIQGVGNINGYDGQICVGIIGMQFQFQCRLLMFYEYIPNIDMNVFYSPFINYCDVRTEIRSISLYTTGATWREPNEYLNYCVRLPTTPRGL